MNVKNRFKGPQLYDIEIIDENSNVVGKIRVTPTAIKWKGKGQHVYRSVTLKQLEKWMESPASKSTMAKK